MDISLTEIDIIRCTTLHLIYPWTRGGVSHVGYFGVHYKLPFKFCEIILFPSKLPSKFEFLEEDRFHFQLNM